MLRPSARRLGVLGVAAGCLAATALPALADTPSSTTTTVSYVASDGTRQFDVYEVDGVTKLSNFTFDNSNQKPFRTIVTDDNRVLNTAGYQVDAEVSNLYRADASAAGGHDYTSFIPSKQLSLGYGLNPLSAVGNKLSVIPQVNLSGLIGDCTDAGVAGLLNIKPLVTPLGIPLDLTGLTAVTDPVIVSACQTLGLASTAHTVDATVNGVTKLVSVPLALPDLPFQLTGATDTGAFTNPSFQGPIASLDPNKTSTTATTKRVMTGTPLPDTTGLLSTVSTALNALLSGVPLVGDTGVVTTTQALSAITTANGAIGGVLNQLAADTNLPASTVSDLIATLTATLKPVTDTVLGAESGQFNAFPVLKVDPASAPAGTYDGSMIVTFWQP